MTLSWIGQKTLEAGGGTKLKMFGPLVELSGHQAQILEPRNKGMYVCCVMEMWYKVRSVLGLCIHTCHMWVLTSAVSSDAGLRS